MLNAVREGEEDYIEAIRYRRRLKIFENFLLNINSPHYIMAGMPRPVFIRGFPDFLKSRFSSRIRVC